MKKTGLALSYASFLVSIGSMPALAETGIAKASIQLHETANMATRTVGLVKKGTEVTFDRISKTIVKITSPATGYTQLSQLAPITKSVESHSSAADSSVQPMLLEKVEESRSASTQPSETAAENLQVFEIVRLPTETDEKLQSATRELGKVQAQVEASSATISKLQEALQQSERTRIQGATRILELEAKIQESEKRQQQLQAALVETQKTEQVLSADIKQLTKRLSSAESTLDDRAKLSSDRDRELASWVSKAQDFEKRARDAESRVTLLTKETTELRSQLTAAITKTQTPVAAPVLSRAESIVQVLADSGRNVKLTEVGVVKLANFDRMVVLQLTKEQYSTLDKTSLAIDEAYQDDEFVYLVLDRELLRKK